MVVLKLKRVKRKQHPRPKLQQSPDKALSRDVGHLEGNIHHLQHREMQNNDIDTSPFPQLDNIVAASLGPICKLYLLHP